MERFYGSTNSKCKRHVAIQRPREKFLTLGPSHLAMEELLAILLRTGVKGSPPYHWLVILLQSFDDGVYGLNRMTVENLVKIKGIGTDKAVTLCAALEMGRRLGELKIKETYQDFSQPFVIAQYVMERLRHEDVEHVWAAMLTSRNKLIQLEHISNGGLVSSLVEQRAVFKKAIACNAAAIILIHNHPSGDSRPSDEDIRLTKLFVSAGQFMGIPVLDHIVIGDNEFTSLSEIGKLS